MTHAQASLQVCAERRLRVPPRPSHSRAFSIALPSASAVRAAPPQVPLPPQRDEGPRAATATQAALRKRLLGRQNKIHYYTRAIQMEQLLGQVTARPPPSPKPTLHATLRARLYARLRAVTRVDATRR